MNDDEPIFVFPDGEARLSDIPISASREECRQNVLSGLERVNKQRVAAGLSPISMPAFASIFSLPIEL